jgi:RNA polymerase sigma-70 factor (ECF subfamily)
MSEEGHLRRQFENLLQQHEQQLFSFIYAMVRNFQDTEDVFQQTCIVLWERFEEFEPGTNFGAWACTVARFRALKLFRKRGRDKTVAFSEETHDALLQTYAAADTLHLEDRRRLLGQCVEELPDHFRTLIERVYGRREQVPDVAAELGRPTRGVYNSIRAARKLLRGCIQKAEQMPVTRSCGR